ncbi:MAG: hypothetical protein AAGC79_09960 [Pseudomonadota bacterium]
MFGIASFFNNPTRLTHSADFSELFDTDGAAEARVSESDTRALSKDAVQDAANAPSLVEADQSQCETVTDRAA